MCTLRTAAALLFVPLFAGLAAGQVQTCPGSGLSVSGGRFGDAWSLRLAGPPAAAAMIASDVAGGPVMTPFGPVCLGLTPALATTAFDLGPTGEVAISGVLPLASPFVAGSELFLQAAIAHPSLPSGLMLTNGAAVTFRPPRLCVLSSSQQGGAGNFVGIDGVSDTVAVNVAAPVTISSHELIRIPRRGWIGFRAPNGALRCVDDTSGAEVLTIPSVWYGFGGSTEFLAASDDGSRLFVTQHGPTGMLKIYDLPSGAQLSSPAFPQNNGLNNGLIAIPGTWLVYVGDVDRFHVVDGATGAFVTSVVFPGGLSSNPVGLRPPVVLGTTLHAGTFSGLISIDTTTHTLVAGPTPVSATLYNFYGVGPGSAGPAVWAADYDSATGTYAAIEVSPETHAVLNTYPLPGNPWTVKPSAGWTEVLVQTNAGSGFSLHALRTSPFQLTTVLPSANPFTLTVLRSDTLTKAYAVVAGPIPIVVSFATDPASPGSATPVSLPPVASLNTLSLVSN